MTNPQAGESWAAPTVEGGWYPDPYGRYDSRYHNGHDWTADVSSGGERYVDPHGIEWGPQRNSLATAALVLGTIGVAIGWIPFLFVIGAVCAILGLVFGVIGLRRSRASGIGRSRAIVGLTTGACGLLAAFAGGLLTVVVYDAVDSYENPRAHTVKIESCDVVGSRATAAGTITNDSSSEADFVVHVDFVRGGTDNVLATSAIQVRNVPAEATTPFTAAGSVDLDEVDCVIDEVTGPFPFGLDIGT